MISRTLTPVDRTAEVSVEEIAESLMLSYLAYYNDQAFQPRTYQAYTRAFGLDNLKRFARALPQPGYMAAFATLPHRKTLTIAIEGTTDMSQISPLLELFNTVGGGSLGLLARVFGFFNDQANAIWTQIHADTDCAAAIANGATMFTFTGHSLGAAVADILSWRFRKTYPAKNVRVIKFGCPRVGNTFYVNRTVDLVKKRNVYVNGDPIHQFPSASIFAMGPLNVIGTATRCNPCSEDTSSDFTLDGSPMLGVQADFTQSSGHYLDMVWLARAFTRDNPWWRHMMKTYRLCLMNLCGRTNDIIKYRINYLEHNDENTWQSRWSPGQLNWDVLDGLSVVPPDEVEPISGTVAIAAQEPGGGGGSWQDDSWDESDESPQVNRQIVPTLPPPIPTSLQPRRRFNRARP